MKLKLIKPSLKYEQQVMSYKKDFEDRNDNLAGCGSLESSTKYYDWLEDCKRSEDIRNISGDKVPSSQYLAINKDNNLVGIINVRHHIDHPILSTWGGHIGYSVLYKYRNQGYAKEMLKLALLKAKELGIKRVLITCREQNLASEKVILANGGIFDKGITVNGITHKRYFIEFL